jgi:chemotaxis protein methyltransferase CheR
MPLDPSVESELEPFGELTEAIFQQRGVDFRNYSQRSLQRRILRRVAAEKAGTVAELQARAESDPACMSRLIGSLTVHTTAIFRDPSFYSALREQVIPLLRTYPFLRFWVAGCSTGEEAYSLAILLHEEGLLGRSRIYATDLNPRVLEMARAGIYTASALRAQASNYRAAGGKGALSDYYISAAGAAILRPFLRDNLVFAAHNLAAGASFNEFHLILCRNVLIYFDRRLQDRVHALLCESLILFGHLALGDSETVRFSSIDSRYESVAPMQRIYRKIR